MMEGGAEWVQFQQNLPRGFDLERQRRAIRCAREDGMFRELDKLNTDIAGAWLRAALLVSYLSITVTFALGIVYFVVAGSTAALGFAEPITRSVPVNWAMSPARLQMWLFLELKFPAEAVSIVPIVFAAILDACSSAVVVWRFSGLAGKQYSFERERKACIVIGVCFVLSAGAIAAKAIYMLVIDSEPKRSTPLLITTCLAFGLLVLLAWFKYLIAYKVDSRSLRTNAFNSTAEAVMAFVMAIDHAVYNYNTNMWFLDAAAAICVSFVLFVYGVRIILDLVLSNGMMPVSSKEAL